MDVTKWVQKNGCDKMENGRGRLTNAVFFGQSRTRSMDLRRKMQNGKTEKLRTLRKLGKLPKLLPLRKGCPQQVCFFRPPLRCTSLLLAHVRARMRLKGEF
ncbi:hypothetical protein POVWA2_032640 [Plasmodium ovale wallikeri]|uniref:Uncharacterized protein n=1 Tax=Plasmodium ovale wallikeri TaxID=864142 RepID=A0A1A8YZ38_PLAOA|nr:hypothetical protein POVWA1_033020 [Plasmodium ovale wallikeri]SBT36972.1 hypothetical protein POVWA2_032640 [Plasmodium ovale wallikeri]